MNTYSELSSAVTAFMGQEGNPETTNMVGTFISLGEDDIYRLLRHDRMIKLYPMPAAPPYLIPDDFLEMSAVFNGYAKCEYVPADTILSAEATTEEPTKWSIFGSEILFDGVPTTKTVASYFARLAPLVQQTNALFTLNSDLFLYAALSHAMIFLRDEARQSIWDGLFQRKVQEIKAASWDARVPKQQTLRVRSI